MNAIENSIKAAVDNHYSEFATGVIAGLKQKLSEHPEIVEYTREIKKYQTLKTQFAEINNSEENEDG